MAISDLSLFQALRTKMHWHQSRQRVLAENVANADTPNYTAHDLKAVTFDDSLKSATAQMVRPAITSTGHMQLQPASAFKNMRDGSFEITPEGNSVVLEEQMMKITANQMDYQAATSLYQRGLGMLKTALGKR